MILIDAEATVDLLNNEAIARTIIKMLRHRPDQAVTFGVHGDWGAGKSSILEMIQASIEGDETVVCLKFNGWRYQGFEDAKIALIEALRATGRSVRDVSESLGIAQSCLHRWKSRDLFDGVRLARAVR